MNYPLKTPDENELSLVDIVNFISESWKIILGFSFLGFGFAILFINMVPKEYEAIAQIRMAQIANVNYKNNNNINSQAINIEEPQALIARMALPTFYPAEAIELCGLADERGAEVALASKVKLSIPKGVSGILDLKIRATSLEVASVCANTIFQIIRASHTQLIAPYIDEAKNKLRIEEERLIRATQAICKGNKSEAETSSTYFSARDEIRHS